MEYFPQTDMCCSIQPNGFDINFRISAGVTSLMFKVKQLFVSLNFGIVSISLPLLQVDCKCAWQNVLVSDKVRPFSVHPS